MQENKKKDEILTELYICISYQIYVFPYTCNRNWIALEDELMVIFATSKQILKCMELCATN